MKKSTLTLTARVANQSRLLCEELTTRRERGAFSVEVVVIALGLFALAGLVIGLLTAWATGKLAGLT